MTDKQSPGETRAPVPTPAPTEHFTPQPAAIGETRTPTFLLPTPAPTVAPVATPAPTVEPVVDRSATGQGEFRVRQKPMMYPSISVVQSSIVCVTVIWGVMVNWWYNCQKVGLNINWKCNQENTTL